MPVQPVDATPSELEALCKGGEVSGWLKMEYPNDESLRVSHETIYRSLFIQPRGALKQELVRTGLYFIVHYPIGSRTKI